MVSGCLGTGAASTGRVHEGHTPRPLVIPAVITVWAGKAMSEEPHSRCLSKALRTGGLGRAAHGLQHHVVHLRRGRGAALFGWGECHLNAFEQGAGAHRLGL